jgi:alkanesulfonate monooxygenase SsuD/methylene tetrahydromethanopterin reductase-like flavin-dependent oxidoreductase (luciferase family)
MLLARYAVPSRRVNGGFPMQAGIFMMPSHPPERAVYEGLQWDLQVLRWADELGFSEAWIGEHFTVPWEPLSAPDLLIAQALLQTRRIKLAPGAHLLPYHHPVELACRVAILDHMAQGRLMLGIGAGAHAGDWQLFGVDGQGGEHRRKMFEALKIMQMVWSAEGGEEYAGEFWTVRVPEPLYGGLNRHHIRPLQKPHPPIGVAGLSPRSDSLVFAGEQGFLPLSVNLNARFTVGHWLAYEEAAARVGHAVSRENWRITIEVFVADTDAEAERWCLEGGMARQQREFTLPLYARFGYLDHVKNDPSIPDDKLTPEFLMRDNWIVGSVDTVTDKLMQLQHTLGGFGTLLMYEFDYGEHPEAWRHSMELLAMEVLPRLSDYPRRAAPEAVASLAAHA